MVQKGTHRTGKLHILDYRGLLLEELDLPAAFGGPDWNGAVATPTLVDIDDDSDLELILNVAHSGFVAYDLPQTGDAGIFVGYRSGQLSRDGTHAKPGPPQSDERSRRRRRQWWRWFHGDVANAG